MNEYYSFTIIPFKDGEEPSVSPPYNLDIVRNTWEHWHIIPNERPAIAPPQPKTNMIKIPGANGSLDLSRILTGYPTYDNRLGTVDFVVLNDFRHWQTAYTDIMTTCHGKPCAAVYSEDPEYYYKGLLTCSGWQTGNYYSTVSISYEFEPYKWRLYDSNSAWLWDPFNFSTGIVTSRAEQGFNASVVVDSANYPIDSDKYATLLDTTETLFLGSRTETDFGSGYFDRMNNISEVIGNAPVCPTFTITPLLGSDTVNVKLVFENPELPVSSQVITKTITHSIANEEFTDIILTNYTGINSVTLKVQGDGIVSWVYRPGRL